jgi:hypothetical protein
MRITGLRRWPVQTFAAAAVVAGLAALLTGCASSEPVTLEAVNPAAAEQATRSAPTVAQPALKPNGCRIALAEVLDTRANPQMGGLGARTLHSRDPAAWVRGGLRALGSDFTLIEPDGAPDVAIRVEILKAYIEAMPDTKSATVVLRAHYDGPHGAAEPRLYRGAHTAMNWISSDGEIQSAMNDALNKAVNAIRADLAGLCAPRPAG